MRKVVILRNESENNYLMWVEACKNKHVEYRIIDLTKNNWYELLMKEPADIYLARPSGITAPFKQLYDERYYIIAQNLKLNI